MEQEKKEDLDIKINLSKLKNTFVRDFKGKNETKRCIVIPIDDNKLYCGKKGVYLDIFGCGLKPNKYGNTHLMRRSLTKEERESMTNEELNNQPILGNISPVKFVTAASVADDVPPIEAEPEEYNDLPF